MTTAARLGLHIAGPVETDLRFRRIQRCLRCDRVLVAVDGEIVGHALEAAAAGETFELEPVLTEEVPAGTRISTVTDCPGGLR